MRTIFKKIRVLMILFTMLFSAYPTAVMVEKDPIVIVLDAGHDATHGGTAAGGAGYNEAELNLKIAQYCKEKLLTYKNVVVYMIRETLQCPYPGTNSTNCNQNRVEFAASVGADYYISFHLNSFDDPDVTGAIVFHPNDNYRPDIAKVGKELAKSILNELVSVGLKNGGVRAVTTASENYQFPDGSQGDTYRVIREGKKAGYPAVIVEHAFVSSPYDRENFLSSDEKLKMLGEADARGIANYLGLEEGDGALDGGTGGGTGTGSNNGTGGSSNSGSNSDAGGGSNGGSNSDAGDNHKPQVPQGKPQFTIPNASKPVIPYEKRERYGGTGLHHNLRNYIIYLHTQKPVCD